MPSCDLLITFLLTGVTQTANQESVASEPAFEA
jgi:hypothetical protein